MLRETEMFQKLFKKVEEAVVPGKERGLLSHHFHAACPSDIAPVRSLKSCGLDKAIPSPCGKGFIVWLNLPHTFYNDDDWGIHYCSPTCVDLKNAQTIACLEILTILLAMQPNLVRIPEACVVTEPSRLRDEGRVVHQARVEKWVDPFRNVSKWEPMVSIYLMKCLILY